MYLTLPPKPTAKGNNAGWRESTLKFKVANGNKSAWSPRTLFGQDTSLVQSLSLCVCVSLALAYQPLSRARYLEAKPVIHLLDIRWISSFINNKFRKCIFFME